MLPFTANGLSFERHGAEVPGQAYEGIGNDFVGNRPAVIEPQRQQHFVAPKRCPHRRLAVQR
jgi:hypothetical protein